MIKDLVKQEIPEAPDTVIDAEIIEFNYTETLINELEAQCMQLTVKDVNDKEGYEKVHRANMDIKKKIAAVKVRGKELRSVGILKNKVIICVERKIENQLTRIREYLEAQKEVIDAVKRQQEEEKEREILARYQERVSKLNGIGMDFDGKVHSYFEIIDQNKITISDDQLRTIDDSLFEAFYNNVKVHFDKYTARLEDEKLKTEQILAREEELKEQQAALKAQREEMDRERALIAEQKFKARELQLINLDMKWNGFKYTYYTHLLISQEEVRAMDDISWNDWVDGAKATIEKAKQEKEKQEAEEKQRNDRYNTRVEQIQALGFRFGDKVFKYDMLEINTNQVNDLPDDLFEQLMAKTKTDIEKLNKIRDDREKLRQRTNLRCGILTAMGMKLSPVDDSYVYEDCNVHTSEITMMENPAWDELIVKIADRIQQIRSELKAKEQERKDALLSDKEKIHQYIDAVLSVQAPDIKDPAAQICLTNALSKIDTAVKELKSHIHGL